MAAVYPIEGPSFARARKGRPANFGRGPSSGLRAYGAPGSPHGPGPVACPRRRKAPPKTRRGPALPKPSPGRTAAARLAAPPAPPPSSGAPAPTAHTPGSGLCVRRGRAPPPRGRGRARIPPRFASFGPRRSLPRDAGDTHRRRRRGWLHVRNDPSLKCLREESVKAPLDAGAELQQEVKNVGGGKLIASVKDADVNVVSLIQSA